MSPRENTFYRPGNTFLHKVDPRLKLCACLLVVIVIFAAGNWIQLLLPLFALIFAFVSLTPLPAAFWRALWMLRWLILFTLLMHLLFSDGRILLGVSWLSLDGLYNGVQTSLQMLMAVAAAAVLSLTTSVEELVAAFGWFVCPFNWLGCKTDEWQKTLLLTMQLLPVVREEINGTAGSDSDETLEPQRKSRWHAMGFFFKSFVDGLLMKGDRVAHEIVEGQASGQQPPSLSGLLPLTLQDQLFTACCVLLLLACVLLGM